MRYTSLTGNRPLLTALKASVLMASLLWAPCTGFAQSTTWQWKSAAGRERVIIDLDDTSSTAPLQVKRTGQNTVFIGAKSGTPAVLQGQAPRGQSLVGTVQENTDGLELQLTNSAFGYLVTQSSPKQIVIDVFSDPLGARWKADGELAPVGTKAQSYTVSAPTQASPTATSQVEDAPSVNVDMMPVQDATVSATIPAEVADTVQVKEADLAPKTAVAQPVAPQSKDAAPAEAKNATAVEAKSAPSVSVQKVTDQEQSSQNASNVDVASAQESPRVLETTGKVNKPGASATTNASATKTVEMKEEVQSPAPQATASSSQDTQASSGATAPAQEVTATKENATSAKPAEPAVEKDAGEQNDTASPAMRGTVISPQEVLGSINKSGPEYWPEDTGIATQLGTNDGQTNEAIPSGFAASTSSVTAQTDEGLDATQGSADPVTAHNAEKQKSMDVVQSIDPASKPASAQAELAEEPRPVIYQDEEGNVVPKPPVLEDVYAEAMKNINEAKFKDALPLLEMLLGMPALTPEMREEILYHRSDAVEAIYTGKPFEGYEDIVTSTNEAMNANLRSTRVPDALHRLGMANLNVGNLAEAEGYFRALRRRYPYDTHVPVDFHLLGRAKMEKGLFAEAEEIFRGVLQDYPDSPAVKDGTISLVQALTGQGKYEEAQVYADFADKRWARYYIEKPSYLLTLADIDYNLGKKEAALQKYWLLYNLLPTDPDSPDVLTRIGDLYFELQQSASALEVFTDVFERFPDTNAGALALLRLSEKGRYDSPLNMAEMFGVFENPGNPLPQVTYQDLYKERPEDARSISALLKYALWQLWDKQYAESMGTAADFIDLYPENTDAEVARDVIMRGFMADLKNSLLEENYGRILTLWNGFPLVRERYGDIDPDLRNALARGYLERGEDEKAMELFAEFLQTPKHPQYSDPTFALYFNKYLETGNWNAMLDLGELVKDWDMTKAMRGQLDYAMALSAENLGLRTRSLELWKALSQDADIPKYQRAYATYFLAKDAEERKDIKDAYAYNLKTLELFDELKQERSDRADEGRRKEAMGALMDITEVANRIPEALEWVDRYNQFVDTASPEYPGLRFREARLYRKLGNTEKAKQILEVIATGYADSPFAAAASTELGTFEVSRDLQNFIPQKR